MKSFTPNQWTWTGHNGMMPKPVGWKKDKIGIGWWNEKAQTSGGGIRW